MQTLYLNDSGHRFVVGDFVGRRFVREKLPVRHNGRTKLRAVDYWEMCGNRAFPTVRIDGKRVAVYPDSDVTPEYWTTFKDKRIRTKERLAMDLTKNIGEQLAQQKANRDAVEFRVLNQTLLATEKELREARALLTELLPFLRSLRGYYAEQTNTSLYAKTDDLIRRTVKILPE